MTVRWNRGDAANAADIQVNYEGREDAKGFFIRSAVLSGALSFLTTEQRARRSRNQRSMASGPQLGSPQNELLSCQEFPSALRQHQ